MKNSDKWVIWHLIGGKQWATPPTELVEFEAASVTLASPTGEDKKHYSYWVPSHQYSEAEVSTSLMEIQINRVVPRSTWIYKGGLGSFIQSTPKAPLYVGTFWPSKQVPQESLIILLPRLLAGRVPFSFSFDYYTHMHTHTHTHASKTTQNLNIL